MRALLLVLMLLATSCSRDTWHAPMVLPDSTTLPLPLPAGGKYKFTGPVTFTIATAPGAVATSTSTDNRKAGQRGGAAATAPGAVATAATTKAGTPWYVFAGLVLAGAVGWAWLRGRFAFLSFFR